MSMMNTMAGAASELSKAYDPGSTQGQAQAIWDEARAFHAEAGDAGQAYAIVIPPPNVTAALHLGHALNNTLQDILTRWHRMLGDNTVWLPGTDHAGIATQTVVEKRVLKEEGKKRTDFGREEFVGKIQAWKDEYEAKITAQLKAMGCSCDWERQAFTMDGPRAKAVREAFFRLFKDGLIYRGKRLVNWDPATQTALADDEVEMEEVDGHFYYMRYPLESSTGVPPVAHGRDAHATEYVTVATTRPETMLGDTAVAINPKDPRAAALLGKSVRLPIVGRIIPIIEDEYVVLADAESEDAKARYASGFLKVTPAHDPNDYELGRKHNLPVINVLGPDGAISDKHGWSDVGEAGFVLGLDRYEARRAIVEWFRQNKLLEDVKPYRHSVGHSYRSHVPIEPYLSDQWYVKVTDDRLAGAALRAMAEREGGDNHGGTEARREEEEIISGTGASPVSGGPVEGHGRDAHATSWEGELRFYPGRYGKTFQSWHENIRDWCISRQLWWGHRIPVWSFCDHAAVDSKSDIVLGDLIKKLVVLEKEGRVALQHGPRRTETAAVDLQNSFACVRSEVDAEALETLEALGFVQDPDVLDTWFSSGLWPLSTLGWPDDTADLHKWNPSNVLCTAREIITLWVSRMVMFNIYFRDCLPFKDVFIHAMIQDGEGRKMSKMLGNGVDPNDIIGSHGADAMRFTLTLITTSTQDVRMPVEHDEKSGKNTSPKFDGGRNFCNKLWNAARFALGHLRAIPPVAADENKWSLADRWILSRLAHTVKDVNEALRSYRFDAYAKSCYDFFWRDLCDWYVEAVKPALRDTSESGRAGQVSNVLAACLDAALRLMHPMIPFITEIIWGKLNEARPSRGLSTRLASDSSPMLIRADWPMMDDGLVDEGAEVIFARLQELIGAIRNIRSKTNVPDRETVEVRISAASNLVGDIEGNRAIVELLGNCKLKEVGPDLLAPANASIAQAAGCDVYVQPVAGKVDVEAEKMRLGKERDVKAKQIETLQARLANPSYSQKAPAHLVQQTRDQLAAAEAELGRIEEQVGRLQ